MTPAEFKTAFPAFKTERAEDIERHTATAALLISKRVAVGASPLGDLYDRGLGLYTCHLIATEKRQVAQGVTWKAGDVLSQSMGTNEGQTSMSRGEQTVLLEMNKPLMRTEYGQQYVETEALGSGGGGARVISATSRGYSTRGTVYTKGPFQTD